MLPSTQIRFQENVTKVLRSGLMARLLHSLATSELEMGQCLSDLSFGEACKCRVFHEQETDASVHHKSTSQSTVCVVRQSLSHAKKQ